MESLFFYSIAEIKSIYRQKVKSYSRKHQTRKRQPTVNVYITVVLKALMHTKIAVRAYFCPPSQTKAYDGIVGALDAMTCLQGLCEQDRGQIGR